MPKPIKKERGCSSAPKRVVSGGFAIWINMAGNTGKRLK